LAESFIEYEQEAGGAKAAVGPPELHPIAMIP